MLLDHFHPPLSDRRDWHGFHAQWASVLAADLNARLPDGWWAQPEVIFGIEVDVGVIEERPAKRVGRISDWTPPQPTMSVAFSIDEESVEIQVFNTGYGPSLMGAIELVSPSNKDRPESRQAFTSKCISILNQGAGLIVVDIVTSRRMNLLRELVQALRVPLEQADQFLYAAAFQVTRNDEDGPQVHIWEERLALEQPLPTLPLWLRVGPMMAVDLQATYSETCRQLRIPTPHAVSP
ncbi:MAG: DUF4058 family protein [Planctomycetota bacterium]|nr:MAG: DUF4058 family protein [Planctomycetota bacterium]REK23591.1 MAG: DUF4058 family protein [Planctomycetota bacterium]REK31184.1 MAG: DUF4058 family protein [Planctomycetota bacterium]